MQGTDRRSRPFMARISIVFTIAILIGLLAILAVLQLTINWPSEKSETIVLISILLFSLLPILLSFVGAIIERSGVIEYRGIKMDIAPIATNALALANVTELLNARRMK